MANAFNLPGSTVVFVTKYILLARTRITYVEHDADGDWYFFGSEKVRSAEDYRKCTLDEILAIDKSVEQFADLARNEYAFINPRGEWERAKQAQQGAGAFVSRMVLQDGLPVMYLYREESPEAQDSGWRIFSGKEDEYYIDTPDNWAFVELTPLLEKDPTLLEVMEYGPGYSFVREVVGGDWTMTQR